MKDPSTEVERFDNEDMKETEFAFVFFYRGKQRDYSNICVGFFEEGKPENHDQDDCGSQEKRLCQKSICAGVPLNIHYC